MPWLTILITLLSFFMSKRSGASNTKAALIAGLAGGATYYTTHQTDWGKATLGSLDGVPPAVTGAPLLGADGTTPITEGGAPVATNVPLVAGGTTSTGGTGITDVLKSWGATGTAAVIGTAAAATGSGIFTSKNLPWFLAAGAAFLLLK